MLTKKERRAKGRSLENVRKTRIDNIRLLIEHYGSTKALADLLDVSVSHISQMAKINPVRAIGEESARNIEAKLELPQGWLDMQR